MTTQHVDDISLLKIAENNPESLDVAALMSPALEIPVADDGSFNVIDRLKKSSLGQFYITRLKHHSAIRKLSIILWRNGFPIYLKIAAFSFNDCRESITYYRDSITDYRDSIIKRWLPRLEWRLDINLARQWFFDPARRWHYDPARRLRKLIPFARYIKKYNIATVRLIDAQTVAMSQPSVFPATDQSYLTATKKSYLFPPINIGKIKDTIIHGGSNLVLCKSGVICHDLYDFRRDFSSEELHSRTRINAKLNRIRWLLHDENPTPLPIAATFIDACAGNYAHWLTEVLPRIALFCSKAQFRHVPIVVNEGLHPNIIESLLKVTGTDRKIITLAIGNAIQVKELYLTSATGYVPFDIRNKELKGHSHGEFSPQALTLCRQTILDNADKKWNQASPEKIYIRRNSGTRRVINPEALEQQLIKHGFVIIEPEKLNFMQQVFLFKNARQIISATGAGLANAIFCNAGTKLGVLMGKHEGMIYRYWVNMLDPLKINISYVLGNTLKNQDIGIHADFFIDDQNITELLKSWET